MSVIISLELLGGEGFGHSAAVRMDHDRAGCVVDDVTRDAAQEGRPQWAITARAHDHEVRILRGIDDHAGRIAVAQQTRNRQVVGRDCGILLALEFAAADWVNRLSGEAKARDSDRLMDTDHPQFRGVGHR